MHVFDEGNNRSMEDSAYDCNSLSSQWHVENTSIHGGSCYYVNDLVLREQNQNEKVDININEDENRRMDEVSNTLLNSNYSSLDNRVKCFVCGELVERQKLSGHLFFGELKCSHCLLEVKTCEQFQAVKCNLKTSSQQKMNSCQYDQTPCQHNQTHCQYNHTPIQHNQTSCHHNQAHSQHNMTSFHHNRNLCQTNMISNQNNQTPYQHNQTSCQHKDFVWPISPTPIEFLKENLSNEMDNVNIEVCCYIAKLNLLNFAKPWKVVIQSYWQVKESNFCSYCKSFKQNSPLKSILSRPFKPKCYKNRNHNIKNRLDFDKNGKNQVTTILESQNNSRLSLLESQKTEKDSLLKFILNQPVRYNVDIINNNNESMKCIIQDNEVSSSQTQTLLTDQWSRDLNNDILGKISGITREHRVQKRVKSRRKSRKSTNKNYVIPIQIQ